MAGVISRGTVLRPELEGAKVPLDARIYLPHSRVKSYRDPGDVCRQLRG